MLVELLRLLRHLMICIGRVVVIDAKINEFVLHLINNLPACILILFLKVLCIGLIVLSNVLLREKHLIISISGGATVL